ncbi:MAG: hypothetical protein AAFS07_09270 [Pseudomonadota bacterium]
MVAIIRQFAVPSASSAQGIAYYRRPSAFYRLFAAAQTEVPAFRPKFRLGA